MLAVVTLAAMSYVAIFIAYDGDYALCGDYPIPALNGGIGLGE